MMSGMGAGMMMGQEDLKAMVEGRLAYVKTALSITEEQATAWKAYEDRPRRRAEHADCAFDRREVPVLDAMRKFIRTVETTPNHIFAGQLSDIPID